MEMVSRVSVCFGIFSCILLLLATVPISVAAEVEDEQKEHVLTLDHSNFSDIVSKHNFIVVEFYAPWCGHCKKLAPQYEKAAYVLRSHDTPVFLAKLDGSEELNKEFTSKFEIRGFPTLKILRNGGKSIQEYKGPRDADGIVAYLKKQAGPASTEMNSAEDAYNFIIEKKISIVGIFPKFSGEEYENFTHIAEKLRADYEFYHTLDAKLLPRGESTVPGPVIRLLKPFDELFVDFMDFHVDAFEKFVEETSLPVVTIFDKDESSHPFVLKFFSSPDAKAMLFVNFSTEVVDIFKPKYYDAALLYKGKGLRFLLGDIESSQNAFQYFGLNAGQVPVMMVQNSDGKKFLKPNLVPDEIAPWLKEYTDGLVKPFIRSEAVPEDNSEPVKLVVADTLQDIFFNSGKNVLMEFYAPWCGHCKKLAPILDEVAVSFDNDPDVVIAKLDATANDITDGVFEINGYPTLYFISSSANVSKFDGARTKEDIINYINQNRGPSKTPIESHDPLKDEL